jgi:3',5'-cyclic AMP phosphodiesterase CpdA
MSRLVAVSDTHCNEPELPPGDILVHAGDFTLSGSRKETEAAMRWLGRQAKKYQWVVCTPGNHDWFFFHAGARVSRQYIQHYSGAENIIYLVDEGTQLGQHFFWGSPWQPKFMDWAWNAKRGAEIKKHWDLIPTNTDILITHGPPKNILDWVGRERVGCEELAAAVKRLRPKLHIFGHIHAPGGCTVAAPYTQYCNAALTTFVDETYKLAHDPLILDI